MSNIKNEKQNNNYNSFVTESKCREDNSMRKAVAAQNEFSNGKILKTALSDTAANQDPLFLAGKRIPTLMVRPPSSVDSEDRVTSQRS